MNSVSAVLVCLIIVLAGCTGGGGGDTATDSTPLATESGGDGSGDADSDPNTASGSSGSDDMPDGIPVLETGERYEYDVRSAVHSDAPESGTLTVDVTAGGEWPGASMSAVRDAPSGRLETPTEEAAAYSPALGEMTYALNVRSIVVSSRIVSGRSTDVRTYEVGDEWRFESSDGDIDFAVVGEERIGGLTAKHVSVTGAEGDLDADIWLVPGVGFPAKFVQTEDGEATIEFTLTAYESP